MGSQQPFAWDGMTVISTTEGGDASPTDSHAIHVEVGAEVVYRMKGMGGGKKSEIRTSDRAVRDHYRELEALRKFTAYRNRKITPLLTAKPRTAPNAPETPVDGVGRPMVVCPKCGGIADRCSLCDELGWVTRRQAEDWEDTRDRG